MLNGLKYCNNVECPAVKNNGGRNLFLNRDKNAAMNMYKIFFFHMTGTVLINYNRQYKIEKDPGNFLKIRRMPINYQT